MLSRDKDVERGLREIEYRLNEKLNQKMEKQFARVNEFEEKIESYNEKLSRDVAADIKTLESRVSDFTKKAEDVCTPLLPPR